MTRQRLRDIYPEMTPEEELEFFNEVCFNVIHNTRWYLDNLDDLWVFEVSWNDYAIKRRLRPKGL